MDHEKEINSLAGENIATQTVLSHVLYEIAKLDPKFSEAIARGFDSAETAMEALAISAGRASSPDYLTKGMHIISELRRASLGRAARPKPKSGI